jgi:hypothetical protein
VIEQNSHSVVWFVLYSPWFLFVVFGRSDAKRYHWQGSNCKPNRHDVW